MKIHGSKSEFIDFHPAGIHSDIYKRGACQILLRVFRKVSELMSPYQSDGGLVPLEDFPERKPRRVS